MGRILVCLGLVLLGVVWWRYRQVRRRGSSTEQQHGTDQVEMSMRACGHCGVHTPVAEGVMLQGRFYCQPEHAVQAGERL